MIQLRRGRFALGLVLSLSVIWAADCSDDGTAPRPDATVAPNLVSMTITPANPTLEVKAAGGETLQLTVTGTYSDGSQKTVKNAEWSVADTNIASVSFGQLSATGTGGSTEISAFVGEIRATTTFTATLKEAVDAAGISATDRTQLDANPTQDAAKAPKLAYPPPGVMLPSNLSPIAIQWEANGNNLFLIVLEHQYLRVTYAFDDTDCVSPLEKPAVKACQFTPDPARWTALLNTARGTAITLSIRGATRSAAGLYASDEQTLEISDVPLTGTIYYWGTGATAEGPENGIYRLGLSVQEAEPFYTRGTSGQDRCAGCHAVSKDGKHMLMTEYDATFTNHMLGIAVSDKQPIFSRDTIRGDFFAFAPDGQTFASSEQGALAIRSLADGSQIEPIAVGGNQKASHPDYSPDGQKLVLVTYNSMIGTIYDDYHFCDGSIVLHDVATKQQTVLVANDGGSNNYYPAFSPDGTLIVFNRATGDNPLMFEALTCGRATPGKGPDLYAHPQAELYIIAAGGGQPTRLQNANGPLRGVTNSWAKWGPARDGDQVWWLAFSSTRDYGNVLINSTRPDIKGVKKPQIWISAIKRDGSVDPSYPAFWLPGQKTNSGNHLPFWVRSLL